MDERTERVEFAQTSLAGFEKASEEEAKALMSNTSIKMFMRGCQDITGRQLIANERQRQVESEGWTPEHDDQHGVEILLLAALCYRDASGEGSAQPTLWPWDAGWWKPKNRQRNLERAGALYQAAADAAERAQDFRRRDEIREHVASCAILLDSVLAAEAN